MPLSHGLGVGLVKCIERLAHGSKDPPFSANQCPSQQSTPKKITNEHLQCRCNGGPRRARGRPAGLARASVATMQLLLTSGEDLKRPGEGGGHVATFLGRPAPHGGLWRPDFVWKLSSTATTAFNRRHVLHLLRTNLGRL